MRISQSNFISGCCPGGWASLHEDQAACSDPPPQAGALQYPTTTTLPCSPRRFKKPYQNILSSCIYRFSLDNITNLLTNLPPTSSSPRVSFSYAPSDSKYILTALVRCKNTGHIKIYISLLINSQ